MKYLLKIPKRPAKKPAFEYQEVILVANDFQPNLDKAFDILFEEVMRQRKQPQLTNKLSTPTSSNYVQLGI
jgi:hypothetical protein